MKVSAFRDFVCPVDGRPLLKENNSLRCDQGHGYDLAREGYCNLLLVQQKASRNPGDNKDMAAARRRFLEGGYFAPIAQRLFKIVAEMARSKPQGPLRIVDTGCGEGYYLHQINKLAQASHDPTSLKLAGCDISKWAVKLAAKRSKDAAWAVAGNRQLPFAPASVDLILSMFGFPDWKSFQAVQSDEGRVVLVEPGLGHLIELRKIIYPEVNLSQPPSLSAATEAGYILSHRNFKNEIPIPPLAGPDKHKFRCDPAKGGLKGDNARAKRVLIWEREEPLQFSVSLQNNSSIQDLLAMTPHAFRIAKKAREDIGALNNLSVSVDVVFRILARKVTHDDV